MNFDGFNKSKNEKDFNGQFSSQLKKFQGSSANRGKTQAPKNNELSEAHKFKQNNFDLS